MALMAGAPFSTTLTPTSSMVDSSRPPPVAASPSTNAVISGLLCLVPWPLGAMGTSPFSLNTLRPSSPPAKPPVSSLRVGYLWGRSGGTAGEAGRWCTGRALVRGWAGACWVRAHAGVRPASLGGRAPHLLASSLITRPLPR